MELSDDSVKGDSPSRQTMFDPNGSVDAGKSQVCPRDELASNADAAVVGGDHISDEEGLSSVDISDVTATHGSVPELLSDDLRLALSLDSNITVDPAKLESSSRPAAKSTMMFCFQQDAFRDEISEDEPASTVEIFFDNEAEAQEEEGWQKAPAPPVFTPLPQPNESTTLKSQDLTTPQAISAHSSRRVHWDDILPKPGVELGDLAPALQDRFWQLKPLLDSAELITDEQIISALQADPDEENVETLAERIIAESVANWSGAVSYRFASDLPPLLAERFEKLKAIIDSPLVTEEQIVSCINNQPDEKDLDLLVAMILQRSEYEAGSVKPSFHSPRGSASAAGQGGACASVALDLPDDRRVLFNQLRDFLPHAVETDSILAAVERFRLVSDVQQLAQYILFPEDARNYREPTPARSYSAAASYWSSFPPLPVARGGRVSPGSDPRIKESVLATLRGHFSPEVVSDELLRDVVDSRFGWADGDAEKLAAEVEKRLQELRDKETAYEKLRQHFSQDVVDNVTLRDAFEREIGWVGDDMEMLKQNIEKRILGLHEECKKD